MRPKIYGQSIKYGGLESTLHFHDKMRCPKCGSDEVQIVTSTEGTGFHAGDACCGYMILGPLGLVCGMCDTGKIKTKVFWKCTHCGCNFQDNQGNQSKVNLSAAAATIGNTPDETVDNIESLCARSSQEISNIRNAINNYRFENIREYAENKPLLAYNIVFFIAIIILGIIFLVSLFDSMGTPLLWILVLVFVGVVGYSSIMSNNDPDLAKSQAKLAFTNAVTYCLDCEVAGHPCRSGWYNIDLTKRIENKDYNKDGYDLEKALQYFMGGKNGGYAVIQISD